MVLCGKKNMDTKFKLENAETVKLNEDFHGKECLSVRSKMIVKCDDRVDEEIFNSLCSKSYFEGLIQLHLINFQKELKSKVKAILNEMQILLKEGQFKDHLYKLDYSQFVKMENNNEFHDFNTMFVEYLKLREEKMEELRKRQEEEEKKRIEREEKEQELADELQGIPTYTITCNSLTNYR